MKILEAIHKMLFDNAAIMNEVKKNYGYARLPINTNWPCLYFFRVSENTGIDLDYDRMTVQFSAWSTDKYQVLKISNLIRAEFGRLKKKVVSLNGGDFVINHSMMAESGDLPSDDKLLFGSFVRVEFRYRGQNIGGL